MLMTPNLPFTRDHLFLRLPGRFLDCRLLHPVLDRAPVPSTAGADSDCCFRRLRAESLRPGRLFFGRFALHSSSPVRRPTAPLQPAIPPPLQQSLHLRPDLLSLRVVVERTTLRPRQPRRYRSRPSAASPLSASASRGRPRPLLRRRLLPREPRALHALFLSKQTM